MTKLSWLLLFVSFNLLANSNISIKDLVYIWKINGSSTLVPQCDVAIKENESNLFYIDSDCNLPNFSAFILREECARKRTNEIKIYAYKDGSYISTIFSPNKILCTSVKHEDAGRIVVDKKTDNSKKYALQYFSGNNKPNLDALTCLNDEYRLVHKNNKFYVLSSENMTLANAKKNFSRLTPQCKDSVWIRPLGIIFNR